MCCHLMAAVVHTSPAQDLGSEFDDTMTMDAEEAVHWHVNDPKGESQDIHLKEVSC